MNLDTKRQGQGLNLSPEHYWSMGKCLIGLDNFILKESASLKRVSLWEEWYGKFGFQKLSQILKSPVRMRMLLILTSVSLRYFKANWDESEYILIRK